MSLKEDVGTILSGHGKIVVQADGTETSCDSFESLDATLRQHGLDHSIPQYIRDSVQAWAAWQNDVQRKNKDIWENHPHKPDTATVVIILEKEADHVSAVRVKAGPG